MRGETQSGPPPSRPSKLYTRFVLAMADMEEGQMAYDAGLRMTTVQWCALMWKMTDVPTVQTLWSENEKCWKMVTTKVIALDSNGKRMTKRVTIPKGPHYVDHFVHVMDDVVDYFPASTIAAKDGPWYRLTKGKLVKSMIDFLEDTVQADAAKVAAYGEAYADGPLAVEDAAPMSYIEQRNRLRDQKQGLIKNATEEQEAIRKQREKLHLVIHSSAAGAEGIGRKMPAGTNVPSEQEEARKAELRLQVSMLTAGGLVEQFMIEKGTV